MTPNATASPTHSAARAVHVTLPAGNAPAVEVEGLTKIFRVPLARLRRALGRKTAPDVRAVHAVNMRIERGEIYGLVGRNGQGKTTLIKCLATLVAPTEGTVRIFGTTAREDAQRIRGLIGLVTSDERSFYGRLTGRQNLTFFARLYGLRERLISLRIEELAEWFDFTGMVDRRFHELSAGNKQRLALMRALLIDPPLILLDEPTRSLDPLAAEELRRLVRERLNRKEGKTILITSHNLHEVEDLCDRVGFLHAGELKLSARMDELREQWLLREQVRLEVRGNVGADGFARILGEMASLQVRPLEGGLQEIIFERARGDGELDQALRRLLAAGVEVANCQTSRDGLVEIMKKLEQ